MWKHLLVENVVQNIRRKFYTLREKIFEIKMLVKHMMKGYRTFEKFAKKIDKLSIRDWGTVEKIKQKLENCVSFK